jgi:hypothetical protein
MNILDTLDAVFDLDVGWRPVSGTIKPVHIANGLFRSLLRVQYPLETAVAFLRPDNGQEERTYEHLVQKTQNPRYAAFSDPTRKPKFEQLREFARGLLAADRAVFPSADHSSFSLTCRELISRDNNDRNVGAFAAGLLRGKDGNGRLSKLVMTWLPEKEQAPADPVTALAWPLLSCEPQLLDGHEPNALRQNPKAAQIVGLLEQAANQLADHEATHSNRLAGLQRTVHFSILGLLAHAQALSANGDLAKRPPLLLTACAAKDSGLARASEESLARFFIAFEDHLVQQLRVRLDRNDPVRYGSRKSEDERLELPAQRRDSVARFFEGIAGYKDAPVNKKLLNQRLECWQRVSRLRGKDDAALVMADTLVECYLTENKGGNPKAFLQGLACRAGLIYPYFEGRSAQKRLRPTVEMLEVLVKSCTSPSRPVPDQEFLDALWSTFGLLTGGRPDDALILKDASIEVGFEELSSNWDAMVTRLADIGLARRYPDNISYIGRFHA